MTTPDKLALAIQVVAKLDLDAEMCANAGCIEDAGVYRDEASAIRELVALWTPKDRPMEPGDYVVGFKNSPVRRIVHVILVTEGRALVADSDYPVGRTVEEYGAAWYLGPVEMP